MWHDVAGHQLIAVQHLLPRRPVYGLDQESAEAAALLAQLLDGFDTVVWSANNPASVIGHVVDYFVQRAIENRLAAVGSLTVIPQVAAGADAGIVAGFFPGLGQMAGQHQPPVLAVHGLAMLGGGLFGYVPQSLQVGGAGGGISGHGDGQDRTAMFASEGYSGRRLHRGHGSVHVGALVGPQLEQALP